jgi:hypothetical protein
MRSRRASVVATSALALGQGPVGFRESISIVAATRVETHAADSALFHCAIRREESPCPSAKSGLVAAIGRKPRHFDSLCSERRLVVCGAARLHLEELAVCLFVGQLVACATPSVARRGIGKAARVETRARLSPFEGAIDERHSAIDLAALAREEEAAHRAPNALDPDDPVGVVAIAFRSVAGEVALAVCGVSIRHRLNVSLCPVDLPRLAPFDAEVIHAALTLVLEVPLVREPALAQIGSPPRAALSLGLRTALLRAAVEVGKEGPLHSVVLRGHLVAPPLAIRARLDPRASRASARREDRSREKDRDDSPHVSLHRTALPSPVLIRFSEVFSSRRRDASPRSRIPFSCVDERMPPYARCDAFPPPVPRSLLSCARPVLSPTPLRSISFSR